MPNNPEVVPTPFLQEPATEMKPGLTDFAAALEAMQGVNEGIRVGELVTIHPTMSDKTLAGLKGKVSGITGEVEPFHYHVDLEGGRSVLVRGDELKRA